MMKIPKLNRILTADERGAVASAWARNFVLETLQEQGTTPACVNVARLEAEAVALLLADWVGQAIQPAEAAARTVRKTRHD